MSELIIQDKVSGIGNVVGVYRFINTVDGKVYVGSTINMRERWLDHIAELNTGKHANKYLSAAWAKYGAGAFTFEIIEKCSAIELAVREKWWIENLAHLNGWDRLYNLSRDPSAPMRGKKHSEEAKEKIRAAMSLPRKGRVKDWKHSEAWFLKRRGYRMSDEHKAKIAASNKGRPVSPETRRKIGHANHNAWLKKKGQLCLNLA